MKLTGLVFLLILLACSSSPTLTHSGAGISIVDKLSPEQRGPLTDLGEVTVEESRQYSGDEQGARDELRNYAARDGAELILLESKARLPCELDSQQNCIVLRGRKFRRAEAAARPSAEL